MTRQRRSSRLISGPEIDLETEVIVDSQGHRVDQAYVEQALAEVEEAVARESGLMWNPQVTLRPYARPHHPSDGSDVGRHTP